jgi:uncharacterized protein (DUF2252 family)
MVDAPKTKSPGKAPTKSPGKAATKPAATSAAAKPAAAKPASSRGTAGVATKSTTTAPTKGAAAKRAASGSAAAKPAAKPAAAAQPHQFTTVAKVQVAEGPDSDALPGPLEIEDASAYSAAWAPEAPSGDVWTARPWVPTSVRLDEGKAVRKRVPRTSHASFEPAAGRDPIAILEAQEKIRLQELVPLRHLRMSESPFAYYRGTPAVMAFDLSATPRTDIIVQASGDAHLSNFGMFASPERTLVFDANDFDETLPAPWEWDVKRLATSIVVAGRANGFSAALNRSATMATVRAYREWMTRYASMRLIEVWYSAITEADIRAAAEAAAGNVAIKDMARARARLDSIFSKARSKDALSAAASLTTVIDGRRMFIDQPPTVQHVALPDGPRVLAEVFEAYRATMAESRREFLERFRFGDFALKVVGVGSVGTACFVCVLEGRDENDPLILQAKEANASVLEEFAGASPFPQHGQRVVIGQRLMQATPDIFLGWAKGPARDFYFRQLWDMKGSVDTTKLLPAGLAFYGGLCAWALARAHARSGDAVAIASYAGTSDTLDGAIADFAESYADLNERDYQDYLAAIKTGRVSIPAA